MQDADGESELWLQGLIIQGSLDLRAQRVGPRLRFEGCIFLGNLYLEKAQLADVFMEECEIVGKLLADQMLVRWNFQLEWSEANGGVSLDDATIGGRLSLLSSTLRAGSHGAPAFSGEDLEVHKAFVGDDVQAIGDVVLLNAKILGTLSFRDAHIQKFQGELPQHGMLKADWIAASAAVFMDGLRVDGGLSLGGGRVQGDLSMERAQLRARRTSSEPAFMGEGLEVAGGIYGRDLRADGEVVLTAAKAGFIGMDGASLKAGANGVAIDAVGSEVASTFSCDEDFSARGAIVVSGATFGGLSIREGEVAGAERGVFKGLALLADNLRARTVYLCDGFRARGQINLALAKIEGALVLSEADLASRGTSELESKSALLGDLLEVGGGIYCRDLVCLGELRLVGATIGAQLSLERAKLKARTSDEYSVSLVGSTVDEVVFLPAEVKGTIDLRAANVRSFWDARDDRFTIETPERLRMEGFTYDSLREPLDAKRRLGWLETSQKERYYPGVYDALASAYRRAGHNGDARKIAIASERRARKDCPRWSPRRFWHDLLWVTIGYGYRNWLAAVWLLFLISMGAVMFTVSEGSFAPATANPPAFSPILYAVDVTVPVLDIGQREAWMATGCVTWVALGLAVSGYALAAAVLAAAAGLLNRDQA